MGSTFWSVLAVVGILAGAMLLPGATAAPAAAAAPAHYSLFLPGVGPVTSNRIPIEPASTNPPPSTPTATPTAKPSPTAPAPKPAPTAPAPLASPTPRSGDAAPPLPVRPNGNYFVSPSGDDADDGRSPSTAWRTFANVRRGKAQSGSAVLAQAGGVWTETVVVPVDDLHLGVYGAGPRPKIIAPDRSYALFVEWKGGFRLEGWEITSATRRTGEWGLVHIAEGDYVVRDVVVHGSDGSMFVTRGPRGLVEDSEFYDNDGEGPTVAVSVGGYEYEGRPSPSDLTIFRNNYVHDTGYRAIANWGTNVLIENNRVERWNKAGLEGSATQAPAGIYVPSRFLGDVYVRGNQLNGSGVELWGIWVDTGPEDRTYVENNTVRNARRCLWAEKTSNVVFRGNRCEATWEAGVWVGSGEDDAPLSANTQVVDNEFVGPVPQTGWIRILPKSDAHVEGNRYLP